MNEYPPSETETPISNGADVKNVPASLPAPKQGSLIGYTVVALGLALFIRFFVAAPYVVAGASMEPNFHDWQYLIVDRVTYHFQEPQRGDIIIFDLPQNTSRALIKRVIGLPGETVVISGQNVNIINAQHTEGFALAEPYLDPANQGGVSDARVTLAPDEFFVLGDNRRVSSDSRLWGALPRKDIVGRVLLRLYPFDALGLFPAHSIYAPDSTVTQE